MGGRQSGRQTLLRTADLVLMVHLNRLPGCQVRFQSVSMKRNNAVIILKTQNAPFRLEIKWQSQIKVNTLQLNPGGRIVSLTRFPPSPVAFVYVMSQRAHVRMSLLSLFYIPRSFSLFLLLRMNLFFCLSFLINIIPLWCDKMPQMNRSTLICISFYFHSANCDDSTVSFIIEFHWAEREKKKKCTATLRCCLASGFGSVRTPVCGGVVGGIFFLVAFMRLLSTYTYVNELAH